MHSMIALIWVASLLIASLPTTGGPVSGFTMTLPSGISWDVQHNDSVTITADSRPVGMGFSARWWPHVVMDDAQLQNDITTNIANGPWTVTGIPRPSITEANGWRYMAAATTMVMFDGKTRVVVERETIRDGRLYQFIGIGPVAATLDLAHTLDTVTFAR